MTAPTARDGVRLTVAEAEKLLQAQSWPSLEKAKELLAEAVAEKGEDYVYPESDKRGGICQYQLEGKPACLVGNVLARHGWSVEALKAADHVSLWNTYDADLGSASLLLSEAQNKQDRGSTWGEAQAWALEHVS
jgi:hypothetical protein